MRRELSGQMISVHLILILLLSVFQLSLLPGGIVQTASGVSSWSQATRTDFLTGDTANVSIAPNGDMTIAIKTKNAEDHFIKSASGDLYTSENLLSGIDTLSIDYFNCTAKIPTIYIVKVQFSQTKKFWYDSGGSKGRWDTLTNGSNSLSLSTLSWNGSSFYYQLSFNPTDPSDDLELDVELSYRHYPTPVTYTSKQFDSTGYSDWNKLSWNSTEPSGTSIKFQLKTAITKEILDTSDFVGPDGKTGSYYTSSGSNIWMGHDHDKWLQYRVTFSTGSQTSLPTLEDVTITYDAYTGIPKPESPLHNSYTMNNTPEFTWCYIEQNYSQKAFQLLLDDDQACSYPIHDSGVQTSSAKKWQFMDGNGPEIIADGKWYWKVRSKDSSGIWSPYSSASMFSIDTTPPVSEVISPVNNSSHRSLVKIWGNASDPANGSGVKKVELMLERLDNFNTWNGNSWNSDKNWVSVSGSDPWSYDVSKIYVSSVLKFRTSTRATDNLGNREKPSGYHYFSIDKQNPTVTITTPNKKIYNYKFTSINGTASDGNDSKIKSVDVCIQANFGYDPMWDGRKWVETYDYIWLSATGTSNWSYGISNLIWYTGEYWIHARASDMAGNERYITHYFYYDQTPPSIKLFDPTAGYWVKNLDEVKGEVWDDYEGGVTKFEINITIGNNYYDPQPTWSPYFSDWILDAHKLNYPSDLETKGIIKATAYDYASNMKSTSINFNFDTRPPRSRTTYTLNHSTVNNLTVIKGTAADSSGIHEVLACLKHVAENRSWDPMNDKWVPGEAWYWANGTTNWTYNTGKVTWKVGTYKFLTKASDLAYEFVHNGPFQSSFNKEISPSWIVFSIGEIKPEISMMINNGSDYTNSRSVVISLDDKGTEAFTIMSFSEDNKTWSAWETFSSTKNHQLSSGDGGKTVYARVKDKNGNLTYANDPIVLDTTPPENVFVVINSNASYTNKDLVNLTISGSDRLSGIASMEFSDDGYNWSSPYPFSKSRTYRVPSGDGKKIVYLRVHDKAGNRVDAYDSIYLDTTPPGNLSIVINNNAEETNSTTVQLILGASDGSSGSGTMAFSNDGNTWSAAETFTTTKVYHLPSGDGKKTVYFRVWDKINNLAQPVSDSIILNTTAVPPSNDNSTADDNSTNNNTNKGKGKDHLPDNKGKKPVNTNRTKKGGSNKGNEPTKSSPPIENYDPGDQRYERENDPADDRPAVIDELIIGEIKLIDADQIISDEDIITDTAGRYPIQN